MNDDLNKVIRNAIIGKAFSESRNRLNLNQKTFSSLVNCSQGTISKIEKGLITISLQNYLHLESVIDMTNDTKVKKELMNLKKKIKVAYIFSEI